MTAKTYYGCGIAFESELDLPGIPLSTAAPPSATIRFGAIPEDQSAPPKAQNWFHATPRRLEFLIPKIARYRVSNGREILIDPCDGASDIDLRLFLMGSAVGGLLHQRGILPLHASTVRVQDSLVAFVGNSGDGKSTQAGMLHQAGYRLAGDDICPLTVQCDGTVTAQYGFPRLKLWSDALDALQIDRRGLERSSVDRDKYDVSTCDRADAQRLPLRAIYLLEYGEDGKEASLCPVRGTDCLPHLLQHTYRYCFVKPMERTKHHFNTCTQVANVVPIYKLQRRRGIEYFSETIKLLQNQWSESVTSKVA